jgi:hypothetical protein
MATFVSQLQVLLSARDGEFLKKLATDYNLPLEELTVKYEGLTVAGFKVPRKRAERKEAEHPCKGTTAKGVACKFSALPGCEFCKRHGKEPKEAKPAKVPKAPKAPKEEVPMHTHDLDGEEHPDCGLCLSHGPFKLPGLTDEFAAHISEQLRLNDKAFIEETLGEEESDVEGPIYQDSDTEAESEFDEE